MNQETIEAVLIQFLHAYEDMIQGMETAKPLAQLAMKRMEDYGRTQGVGQHWHLIMEEDYAYANAALLQYRRL